MTSAKKPPEPVPTPTPTPVPTPTPILTPAPMVPFVLTPGVPVETGEIAMRCSACNKLSRWQQAFIDYHRGGTATCPVCGAVGKL